MSEVNFLEKANENQPRIFTLLRILLGSILIIKGIMFINDTTMLQALIKETGIGVFSNNAKILSFIVPYINLLGGIFIIIGLFTKTCSIINIPIVIVAMFFVNIKNINTGGGGFELVVSLVVLVLLILFTIKGSGMLSADEYFHLLKEHKDP
jgi:uncharacterized membrane protein YphA (DoxX/SURF4 family)